jgi:hypothetical protein
VSLGQRAERARLVEARIMEILPRSLRTDRD